MKSSTRKILDSSYNNDEQVINYFYDSIKEEIVKQNSVKFKNAPKSIPNKDIKVDVKHKVVSQNNAQDILDCLEIEPELKLSILAGLVPQNDFAKSFITNSNNLEEKICFIKVEIVTKEIEIEKKSISTNDKKSITNLLSGNTDNTVTHKIERLKIGFKWIIALKYKDEDSYLDNNLEDIEAVIASSIENYEIPEMENTYEVVVYDSYLKEMKGNSLKDIQNTLQSIKKKKTIDNVKPSLLEIKLMELSKFGENYDVKIESITLNHDNELNSFCSGRNIISLHEINNYNDYLTDKEVNIASKIKKFKEDFDSEFKDSVIKLRKLEKCDLPNLFKKYDDGITKFNTHTILERIKDIKFFKKFKKVTFLKKNKELEKKQNTLYFGYSQNLKRMHEDEWSNLRSTLYSYIFEGSEIEIKFIKIVDYDLYEEDKLPKVCCKNGVLKMCFFKWSENDEYILIDNKKKKSSKKVISDNYKNILLLGESGVGKSTYINAIFNYFLFASLDDAENGKPECPIQAKFSYYNENHEIIEIKMGDEDDDNERFKEGQSSTQVAKAYELKEKQIRIIDTPGMGDTRGIDVDRENFRNTINFIENYGYLDCICFLVKPNNVRLGQIFQYCFKELFSNLSKSSVKNIVFCFTNTRGTMYRPGETLNPLTQLVDDINATHSAEIPLSYENIFCLDNEGFRYLMLIKHEIKLGALERKDYVQSWKHSVSESNRMLDYIKNLGRMETKDIVVLNKFKFGLMDWASETVKNLKELVKEVIVREQEIKNQKDAGSKKNKESLKILEKQINNLNNIRKEVINYCARLYSYVHKHSIAIFNDYLEAHIDVSIRDEANKEYFTKTESVLLEKLKQLKIEYIESRKKASVPSETEYEEIRDKLSEYNSTNIEEFFDETHL